MNKQLQDTAKMDNSYLVQTVSWQGDQNLLMKTYVLMPDLVYYS